MTATKQREIERLRADVAQIQQRIRAAAGDLDPSEVIAQARSLRSVLWRATHGGGIDTDDLREPPARPAPTPTETEP
jgi:hypothetical protein